MTVLADIGRGSIVCSDVVQVWLGSDQAIVSWEAGGGGEQCGAFTDWSYRLEVEAGNMTRLLTNITRPPVQVGRCR